MYGCIKLDVYIYEQEVTIKMQAKIKQTKTNNKQSNKQSLVQPDKVFPSGVAILSRGDGGGSLSCLLCEVLCVEKGFWI
jgi:hypothetical protein